MQVEEQQHEKLKGITHSPYYGCTVRVLSKALVSYEGVLDGISINKEKIFLKNVRVKTDLTESYGQNTNPFDELDLTNQHDKLNSIIIDHLTNDTRIYEEVCLNVRDIQELRLVELPSTFHESKAKLRAIDPCLLDIRLSSSDEHESRSAELNTDNLSYTPIGRQKRGESFGSNGSSALVSSSSNESTSSFHCRSGEKLADESNDESIDERIDNTRLLTTTSGKTNQKSVTLVAKKVLPKKIERRADISTTSSINANSSNNRQGISTTTRINVANTPKRDIPTEQNRRTSPIRVTITSRLNPNATPFYVPHQHLPMTQNQTFTFYERQSFQPRLQPVISPDRSQSLPFGMNSSYNQYQTNFNPNQNHVHQRFIPPRQMAMQNNIPITKTTRSNTKAIRTPPPMIKYRVHPPNFCPNRQSYPAQQHNHEKSSNINQHQELSRHASLPTRYPTTSASRAPRIVRNNVVRRSTASICSTASLPYQHSTINEYNPSQSNTTIPKPIGSHRKQRTTSCASSCSSLSVDINSHPIIRNEASSNPMISLESQYDFDKANEEFRRYLELEELVSRHPTSNSLIDLSLNDNSMEEESKIGSYKRDVSFFDRISCTATTGTAVGYTEMDETEKNLETFGQDALLMISNADDENVWHM